MSTPTQLPGVNYNILTTERLTLKEITPAILSDLHTNYGDGEIMRVLHLANSAELQLEREKFAGGLTMYDVAFRYFLMTETASGDFIGRCGFHTWRPQHARAELGYAIKQAAHMGKGYMKEALKAVVAYGFEHMGLNRVEAFTATHNTPSQRLLKGLGFLPEGTLREHYHKNGVIEDSVCFSLLRNEYVVLKHTSVFTGIAS